jgi:hypothetical protein
MGLIPTRAHKLIVIVSLLCVGLMSIYPFVARTLAQDEDATDVPFPTAIATATSAITPTFTPQPTALSSEATAEVTAETTAALTLDDAVATAAAAQATADSLSAENKTLQESLASAQTDKGATVFAVVIIVIGLLLAFAVFFGLRRSGD